jgi:tetratricopeptide (TPR) repeat protein
MALFDLARGESDLYTKDNLLKAASEAFAQILAKDPGRLEVLYNQALACYEWGDNKSKTLNLIERYLAQDSQSKWAKELSSIRDKLRVSSYEIFDKEVEDAFKHGQLDRLAQLVSFSPHAVWLIKKSLIVSLKLEIEGDRAGAGQAFGIAQAIEKAYRQFTGEAHYGQLIDFYTKLSDEQKQQKYRADRMAKAALTYYQCGNEDASLALSAQALVVYQQLHDYWQEALMHVLRGDCYFYRRSEYDRALAAYQATLLAAEHSQDPDVRAWAYGNIGVIYQDGGNYYDMKTYVDRMLVLAEQLKNPAYQAFALNYFGNLYRELGGWEESIRYYSKALILNRRMGDQPGQLQNLEHIGFLYQRSKEFYKSIDFL